MVASQASSWLRQLLYPLIVTSEAFLIGEITSFCHVVSLRLFLSYVNKSVRREEDR